MRERTGKEGGGRAKNMAGGQKRKILHVAMIWEEGDKVEGWAWVRCGLTSRGGTFV